MSAPFILYKTHGRVATITLNRPDLRNAVASHADCEELVSAAQAANADAGISVLIVTGAGGAFSAGGDLKGMRDRNGLGPLKTPADTRANYRRGVQQIPLTFAGLEIATIAAVHGHAIGLGCDLAGYCDMRIASADAKFASSFVKMGLTPGDGGAWLMPRLVGYARAAEMILTGDTISATEALAYGLVNAVVPADRLMMEAEALAQRIAVNPPRTVRLAKRLLMESRHARLPDMLELSAAFQALAHETDDHNEAVKAFLDKRPAVFTGS